MLKYAQEQTLPAVPHESLEAAWLAWRDGEPAPRWQEFLPVPGQPCDSDTVFLVLQLDIEFRAKAGLPGLLDEPYFRHPRLQEADARLAPDRLAELVRWEYQQRWKRGRGVGREEYLAMLPEQEALLRALRVRWNCSKCERTGVPLEDDRAAQVDCPDCQAVHAVADLFPVRRWAGRAEEEATHDQDEPGREPAPAVSAASMPTQIGRYRIEKVLGEGGFARVYLAHDDQLKRAVAIKVPRPERLSRPEDAEAYLTEARTVASLDHPNIVPIFDVGTTPDGLCYVVSKVIEGSDLAQKIRQARPSYTESAGWIASVAEALHYAHRKGLVHRDIKPANILIDTSDKPYVADFGLALKEEDFGKGATFAGTPDYMSPEQARGEGHRVDGRSDIFSLGVVCYELLVGRRPFKADALAELLEQITKLEARPPRQVDDRIPKELERICFKALSKRTSERYLTAKDMADDLRHFLGSTSAVEKAMVGFKPIDDAAASTPVASPVPTPASDTRPIKIVPKGLRSFDANDADFFLELLPGPRDRDGLPDSLRFWKTRIEATDRDSTFSVGLLYGPSGSGKSSLVKAGLLPRLAGPAIAVYVEATADDTEVRLLKGLRKHCPDVPEFLGVVEALAALRRGHYLPAGKKVVLILDQFEQWLHAPRTAQNTDLVQALRHCDGGKVQCIVMVRDDFWLSVSRFMGDMEVELVQGHNMALVDLFDPRHAKKVLAAFGRAFGALPERADGLTREQEAFLDRAVAGLAQEGKVISVRLALFAEMVKGKPWTPATLKEVGGMEGVGITFLEETFAASTAPPQHRLHQKAAQAVLKALLPDSGTDIKGNMRSQHELVQASGYAGRSRDFDALLRILDGELRLITPTDPEGNDAGEPGGVSPRSSEARYYQLTHDYLVPSLRDWLTRKQKETRRGRAELLLADRAVVWNARPENRQLPSLWQWVSIRWLTHKKNWTPSQRKMMSRATRYHAVQGMLFVALAALLGFAGYEGHGRLQAHALRRSLLDANTNEVPTIVTDMSSYRRWIDPLLRDAAAEAEASKDARKQLHASLALLPVDERQVNYLYGRLLDAEPHQVPVLRDALASHKEALLDKLWAVVESPEKGKESHRLRAAAALAMYDPQSEKWAKANALVVDDLVLENAVFLSHWSEAFRPVKGRLLSPLSVVFRDRQPDRAAERQLATNLLADYANDQPQVLADLLMDADEQQFARLFRKVKDEKHGDRSVSGLLAEIDKQAAVVKDQKIYESKGKLAEGDVKVKVSQGDFLPAKRFEVKLQAGKKYRLTMDSQEFDSFLVLQDKTGKELAFDDDGGGNLNSLLVYTPSSDDTYTVFAASFKGTGSFVLKIVEAMGGDDGKEKLAKRQANAAVALLKMDRPEKVWPLLKHSPDPRVRSYLIHRLGPLGADAAAIIKRLDEEPDLTIRRALLLSLGEFGEEKLSPEERKGLTVKLQAIYRTEADSGLHASSEWLLRTWKEEGWLKQVNEEWAQDQEQREKRLGAIKQLLTKDKEKTPPQWYVNGQGQTMVVIPGPVEFVMGSPATEAGGQGYEPQHKKRIGRTIAIAAKSVTKEQFLRFNGKYSHSEMRRYPEPTCPIGGVVWYDAAQYCNWLSKEEGVDKDQWCYETNPNGHVTKLKQNYLSLMGYRLPTEAEMEYATRAGAVTARYYGETEEVLAKYAWYQKNAQDQTWPVGSLKPNDLGLFDVQGNVYTWCQEKYVAYPSNPKGAAVDDKEYSLDINTDSRVLRGGSFDDRASLVRSASRDGYAPATRDDSYGLRPARTFTP